MKCSKKLIPMTLEGCVVRISDIIGYIGRDITDALALGIIKSDLPESVTNVIGDDNKQMINNIIIDIITNSYNKPYLKISSNVYKAILELKEFNTKNIYMKANTKENLKMYHDAFYKLFYYYLENINNKECSINLVFLNMMNQKYISENTNVRKVIDYIAGMTDDFFLNEYKK